MGEEFEIGTFDAIYFDTFEESYRDHLEFFRHVPRLLKGPHARFSFFHGVGQNDPAWAKVFTEVVERHLNDLGMNTQWTEVDIDRRRYWNGFVENPRPAPDVQRLVPLCMLAPTVPRTFVERDAVRFGELVCVDAVSENSGDDSSSENSDDYAVSEDSDDDASSEASDDYAVSEDSDDDVQDGGPASERGRSASKKSEFEMPVA
ncbi:hypothetical protein EW146_g9264 [Bondarzewia mesenterica]|uniref:Uncharacterized protein n=1 Tax=Bondarzewia mesenterica TaxID=1095465 RepID=A0A4S4L7P9_9AGAM|nr:hypothetical protein EW146_g9264 [Bondarzewia mesenterica]